MNKIYKSFLYKVLLVVVLICAGVKGWGQVTLANYKFENNLTVEPGAIGSPTLTASVAPTYFAGASGTDLAASHATSTGKYFELLISTTGYTAIDISFAGRSSQTGSTWVVTGDATGGTTFSAITSLTCANGSFAALSATALGASYDNKPSIRIRITAGGTSATLRIDNLIIRGIFAPPLGSISLSPTTQAKGPYCSSTTNSISLDYTTTGTVTAPFIQLSNSTGGFASGTTNLGGAVSGSAPFTITGTLPASLPSSASYRVRIVSTDAIPIVSLDNASNINISAPASISSQPTNQSVTSPATATFSVTASNVFSYQWQLNTGSGFANISGATSSTYTTGATNASMNGYTYKCVITGLAPCSDVILTNAATLGVSTGPCVSDLSGYPTTAGGWIISGASVSSAQSCTGNGILFTANGDNIVTPSVFNPSKLDFTKKRSGTAPVGWNMNIQIGPTSSGPWTLVTNINTITNSCASNPQIDLSAYTGTQYIKFTDLRTSGSNQIGIDDITITCNTTCTPTTVVTSFLPASGPVGTLVTITGTGFSATPASGGVKFGSVISPAYTLVNATTIIAEVPAGLGVSSSVSVANGTACFSNPLPTFTLINTSGTCTGTFSDLIISEIYDPATGNNHYIEIFNGTNSSIDLDATGTDYSLQIFNDPSATTTFDISGTILPGQVRVYYGGSNGLSLATGTQSIY